VKQRRNVGGLELEFEAPEAGRYMAPIIVCPGLFQSFDCWRPLTSMLAHRGWEIYFAARGPDDASPNDTGFGWQANLDRVATAAGALGEKVVLFGSDLGAAMALAVVERTGTLALALFSPSRPDRLLDALNASSGLMESRNRGPWRQAPRRIAKLAANPSHVTVESALLLEEASRAGFEVPGQHPPALVFVGNDDSLVPGPESALFAAGAYSKQARARLSGGWWPAGGPASIADEVHRYLILTLGDRVVEFPEEILADD